MIAVSPRKLFSVIVIAACLSAAIVMTTLAGHVNHLLSDGYHGYRSHVHLNLTPSGTEKFTPILILPLFLGCRDACPANLHLLRHIVRQYEQPLRLIVLPVQAENDAIPDLQRYAALTGLEPEVLSPDASAAWQFLSTREHIRRSLADRPAHAGHLYLYYPARSELLTYMDPDIDAVVDDLIKLTQGTNNGAIVLSASSR